VPQKSVFAARLNAVKAAQLTPGEIALEDRLAQMAAQVKAGVKVRAVFDLDNTVFDTRGRTLHVLREFGRLTGSHAFANLELEDMKVDGLETARNIVPPLSQAVLDEVQKFWLLEFWNPDNLVHDIPVPGVLEIIRRCAEAGAEIAFLTGRAESFIDDAGREKGFREQTMAQLARAGIVVDDPDQLHLKPGRDVPTAPYKDTVLGRFKSEGMVGLFLTEGRRDIDHLIQQDPDIACFRLECSFERGGPECKGVPVLDDRLW
jgi:hypothetical protein